MRYHRAERSTSGHCAESDAHSNTYSNANANTDSNANTDACSNTNTYTYTDSNANARACVTSVQRLVVQCQRKRRLRNDHRDSNWQHRP